MDEYDGGSRFCYAAYYVAYALRLCVWWILDWCERWWYAVLYYVWRERTQLGWNERDDIVCEMGTTVSGDP